MADLEWRASGSATMGYVGKASRVVLTLRASDHVHTKVYMDPDTSLATIVLVDDDQTEVKIMCGVRQMVPTLREILKAFEARLAELPE